MSQDMWNALEAVSWTMHEGRVVRPCWGGTVVVLLDDSTERVVECSILEIADGLRLSVAMGDLVLVSLPQSGKGRGLVLGRTAAADEAMPAAEAPGTHDTPQTPAVIPDSLLIEAGRELILRVGDGSITIRADGKILIKGKDLVSHAQRVNRIKGGSVAIN